MPIFEYENYDDEIFNEFGDDEFGDDEFGDVKRKPAAVKKKTIKVIKKPESFFSRQVQKLGQSKNIEDRRTDTWVISGYLTWNTWFHLASLVNTGIFNALASHGYFVLNVSSTDRDRRNSQYNFFIRVNILRGYNANQVKNSLVNVLYRTIALPGSIRITKAMNNDFN
jgi:hypothetical protein